MANWKEALLKLYTPDVGSIWAAPNKIWDNGFANGKPGEDLHPAIVEKNSPCNTLTYVIPGTSKKHIGSCIFRVMLNPSDINKTNSFFLIEFSMPYSKNQMSQLSQGWNNVHKLNDTQLNEFKMQLKFCKG